MDAITVAIFATTIQEESPLTGDDDYHFFAVRCTPPLQSKEKVEDEQAKLSVS